MNLNELRDRAYKTACEHGFHEEEKSNNHYFMLIITELAEAVEADRKGQYADLEHWEEHYKLLGQHAEFLTRLRDSGFEAFIKGTFEEELADAAIRCLDFCGMEDIDLSYLQDILERTSSKDLINDFDKKWNMAECIFRVSSSLFVNFFNNKEKINSILLRIFSLAEKLNIDLEKYIELKMAYNENRPYKHEKSY